MNRRGRRRGPVLAVMAVDVDDVAALEYPGEFDGPLARDAIVPDGQVNVDQAGRLRRFDVRRSPSPNTVWSTTLTSHNTIVAPIAPRKLSIPNPDDTQDVM